MLHLREPLCSIERRHSLHVLVHLGGRIGKFPGHNSALARVVARYCQPQVAVKHVYQPGEIRHAPADVLFDHKAVADPELIGGLGHELHKPDGALGRHCVRLPARLHLDDGLHQLDRHVVHRGVIGYPTGRNARQLSAFCSMRP
jgi:hypothetical protein